MNTEILLSDQFLQISKLKNKVVFLLKQKKNSLMDIYHFKRHLMLNLLM